MTITRTQCDDVRNACLECLRVAQAQARGLQIISRELFADLRSDSDIGVAMAWVELSVRTKNLLYNHAPKRTESFRKSWTPEVAAHFVLNRPQNERRFEWRGKTFETACECIGNIVPDLCLVMEHFVGGRDDAYHYLRSDPTLSDFVNAVRILNRTVLEADIESEWAASVRGLVDPAGFLPELPTVNHFEESHRYHGWIWDDKYKASVAEDWLAPEEEETPSTYPLRGSWAAQSLAEHLHVLHAVGVQPFRGDEIDEMASQNYEPEVIESLKCFNRDMQMLTSDEMQEYEELASRLHPISGVKLGPIRATCVAYIIRKIGKRLEWQVNGYPATLDESTFSPVNPYSRYAYRELREWKERVQMCYDMLDEIDIATLNEARRIEDLFPKGSRQTKPIGLPRTHRSNSTGSMEETINEADAEILQALLESAIPLKQDELAIRATGLSVNSNFATRCSGLRRRGLITSGKGRGSKGYEITDKGRDLLFRHNGHDDLDH